MIDRRVAGLLVVLGAGTAGCGPGATTPAGRSLDALAGSRPARSGSASARRAGLAALAASRHAESPWSLVANLAEDPVCPAGTTAARVRCHLRAPATRIRLRRTPPGWTLLLVMPELSDHVHRVRLVPGSDGPIAVELESQN
jgi:hypothetical protein